MDKSPLPQSGFVTRSGTQLMRNGRVFRFAGGNLDNLALASDRFSQGSTDQYYPSRYAVDNAFETLQKMGGTVARIYSTGSQGTPLSIEPTLGRFNEKALEHLDYVLKSARDHGIMVIPVLVSEQNFYVGGKIVFQDWRNGTGFFSEPVVSDFEQYIQTLVTRVNSLTRIAYKDDPTIFGWETCNEIRFSPIAWEDRIGSFIRKLDPNHLIINGNDDMEKEPDPERLAIPSFDIYVKHYYRYWNFEWQLERDGSAVANANKVFIVGEYGWDKGNFTVPELRETLTAVENDPRVSGDMFWALRGYQEPGVPFPVPGEGGEWWALYYDGLDTGTNTAADMRERALIIQAHAVKMSEKTAAL